MQNIELEKIYNKLVTKGTYTHECGNITLEGTCVLRSIHFTVAAARSKKTLLTIHHTFVTPNGSPYFALKHKRFFETPQYRSISAYATTYCQNFRLNPDRYS